MYSRHVNPFEAEWQGGIVCHPLPALRTPQVFSYGGTASGRPRADAQECVPPGASHSSCLPGGTAFWPSESGRTGVRPSRRSALLRSPRRDGLPAVRERTHRSASLQALRTPQVSPRRDGLPAVRERTHRSASLQALRTPQVSSEGRPSGRPRADAQECVPPGAPHSSGLPGGTASGRPRADAQECVPPGASHSPGLAPEGRPSGRPRPALLIPAAVV